MHIPDFDKFESLSRRQIIYRITTITKFSVWESIGLAVENNVLNLLRGDWLSDESPFREFNSK